MVSGIEQSGNINRSSSAKTRTVADLKKVAREQFGAMGINGKAADDLSMMALKICLQQMEDSIKTKPV